MCTHTHTHFIEEQPVISKKPLRVSRRDLEVRDREPHTRSAVALHCCPGNCQSLKSSTKGRGKSVQGDLQFSPSLIISENIFPNA